VKCCSTSIVKSGQRMGKNKGSRSFGSKHPLKAVISTEKEMEK
jgi:hypothetical protein